MTLKGVIDGINRHINDNLWYYLISILFMATGIILGLYCVKYMGDTDRETLLSYISSLNSSNALGSLSNKAVFIGTLKNNLPVILGFWVLGLTIVGTPFILFLDIYKGFTLGFTFSFFIYGLKQKGILLSILGILPQNIVYIPCVLLLSVFAMEYSIGIIKDKFHIGRSYGDSLSIRTYTMVFTMVAVIMMSGFLIEAYITPALVRLALRGI